MPILIEHPEFLQPRRDTALIPFYATELNKVEDFYTFIDKFRSFNSVNVVVVNDGTSNLDPKLINAGLVIQSEDGLNHGKAEAIRLGLKVILGNSDYQPGYIVQYNGDSDQSYLEPSKLLARVKDISNSNPNQPTLVIGERYSSKLETPPNPDSITYRQSILILQRALAAKWGYRVSDWVSGSRAFTTAFAQRFLSMSVSQYYGVEAEELTVAYLTDTKVSIEPLRVSRPRDPDTQASKLLQSLYAILSHKKALKEKGQEDVVELLEFVMQSITDSIDLFEVDLNRIGLPATIEFRKTSNGYTTSLPEEVVNKHYDTSIHPFAFREAV